MSAPGSQKPLNAVILYHDADTTHLRIFETHIDPLRRRQLISIWHRGKLAPGQDMERETTERLRQAHLVLLLVSADFNSTWDSQWSEQLLSALCKTPAQLTQVIPLALRPCVWSGLPFFGLQPLPKDGQPLIVDGHPFESRFATVCKELMELAAARPRSLAVRAANFSEDDAGSGQSSLPVLATDLVDQISTIEKLRQSSQMPLVRVPLEAASPPSPSPDSSSATLLESEEQEPDDHQHSSSSDTLQARTKAFLSAQSLISSADTYVEGKASLLDLLRIVARAASTVQREDIVAAIARLVTDASAPGSNGHSLMLKYLLNDSLNERVVLLAPISRIVVGRERADIVFPNPSISKRHCELFFQSGFWFLRDLGSTNGTELNGHRVTSCIAIDKGDKITVANSTIVVVDLT